MMSDISPCIGCERPCGPVFRVAADKLQPVTQLVIANSGLETIEGDVNPPIIEVTRVLDKGLADIGCRLDPASITVRLAAKTFELSLV